MGPLFWVRKGLLTLNTFPWKLLNSEKFHPGRGRFPFERLCNFFFCLFFLYKRRMKNEIPSVCLTSGSWRICQPMGTSLNSGSNHLICFTVYIVHGTMWRFTLLVNLNIFNGARHGSVPCKCFVMLVCNLRSFGKYYGHCNGLQLWKPFYHRQ